MFYFWEFFFSRSILQALVCNCFFKFWKYMSNWQLWLNLRFYQKSSKFVKLHTQFQLFDLTKVFCLANSFFHLWFFKLSLMFTPWWIISTLNKNTGNEHNGMCYCKKSIFQDYSRPASAVCRALLTAAPIRLGATDFSKFLFFSDELLAHLATILGMSKIVCIIVLFSFKKSIHVAYSRLPWVLVIQK